MDLYLTEKDTGWRLSFCLLPDEVKAKTTGNFISYNFINRGEVKMPNGQKLNSYSWKGTLPGEGMRKMPFIKQHPSTLSGGQKQRLALGVALMHEAPIIVLDEPTSGLDGTNMRNVSRMIRKLAKMGRTIIVITHDAECALACCERAIRLENGCITDDFQIRGAELLLDKIGYDKKEG